MSERSDRFRDEMKAEILAGIRENQKVPEMYDNLRYCGDCPGGPHLSELQEVKCRQVRGDQTS